MTRYSGWQVIRQVLKDIGKVEMIIILRETPQSNC